MINFINASQTTNFDFSGTLRVGVMIVGVMTVGVLSVGVMTVGVLSVGVMTLSRFSHIHTLAKVRAVYNFQFPHLKKKIIANF